MVNFVGTLHPAGTVTPGAVEDVAEGVVAGVVEGLTVLVLRLVLDAGFVVEDVVGFDVEELVGFEVEELVFDELVVVEVGVGAGEDDTQPRS